MRVYRIAKKHYAMDLTGLGAKLYGGRWNHRGRGLIYTSETRSLAMLEFLVHVSLPCVPTSLSIAAIEIPDDLVPEEMTFGLLPRNWREHPSSSKLADIGTQWAKSNRGVLLRVPSAVVEKEFNVLMNPLHPDIVRVVLLELEPFEMDERLYR
jgi:RES domain-containing protein